MFHIPENILELYEPVSFHKLFFRMQQVDSMALGNKLTQYYDWEPLDLLTMAEAEWFMENELGMVKVEPDEKEQQLIESRADRHLKMQYVCTYVYPDIKARNRLATQEEIEGFHSADKIMDNSIEMFTEKAMNNVNNAKTWYDIAEDWKRRKERDKQIPIHLYCDEQGKFADIDYHPVMPKIAQYSLYHVLGWAPVPEETFSSWQYYLKFLVDIGYVNDFVKELEQK